jgi:O-antigen ligase
MVDVRHNEAAVGVTEQIVGTIVFLSLIIGLFSPWEDYVNHLEFSLTAAAAPKGFSVSHTLIMIDFVLVFLLAIFSVKSLLNTLSFLLPVLLLCIWILLSSRWSADPASSFNRGVRLLFPVLFAWYLAARYSESQWVAFLTRCYAIVALASLSVMLLMPDLGLSGLGGANVAAWRGALAHKNALGSAMAFGVVISGYSVITRGNTRLFSALTFLSCLLLLVMSRSLTAIMSAFIAMMIAMMGSFLQSRHRAPVLKTFSLVCLAVVIIIGLIWPYLDIDLSHLPGLAGRSASLSGRTDVWRAVWIAIRQRLLLGYGYGFWEQESVMRANIWRYLNWAPPEAHSNWMDAWLQLGLIGLVLTSTTWLIAVRRAAWLTFIGYRHGALLYLTILSCALSQSYAETIQFSPGVAAVFWWVSCYLCVARLTHRVGLGSKHLFPTPAAQRSLSFVIESVHR